MHKDTRDGFVGEPFCNPPQPINLLNNGERGQNDAASAPYIKSLAYFEVSPDLSPALDDKHT